MTVPRLRLLLIYVLITSYRPDLVIYNKESNSIFMLKLTCPLDSSCHLEAARDRKQGKTETVSEFQCVGVTFSYDTLELSVLGHCLPSSLTSLKNCVSCILDVEKFFQSDCR